MRASDPDAKRRRLYAMLSACLDDRLLAGRTEILEYLNQLGVALQSRERITWRRVAYWAEHKDFPLLRGLYGRHTRFVAVTAKLAVLAWILSRPHNGFPRMFRVRPRWDLHPRVATPFSTAPESPCVPLAAHSASSA